MYTTAIKSRRHCWMPLCMPSSHHLMSNLSSIGVTWLPWFLSRLLPGKSGWNCETVDRRHLQTPSLIRRQKKWTRMTSSTRVGWLVIACWETEMFLWNWVLVYLDLYRYEIEWYPNGFDFLKLTLMHVSFYLFLFKATLLSACWDVECLQVKKSLRSLLFLWIFV